MDKCPIMALDSRIRKKFDREVSSILHKSRRRKAQRLFKPELKSQGAFRSRTTVRKRDRDTDIYTDFFSDKMLMIQVIREGVTYALFDIIKHATPFTEEDWAEFLNTTPKSLQRYKQSSKTFKPIQSEKIIEMAEVTNTGLDVFGHMDKFKLWLETPNFALGNLKPIELLKDSYGKEMVMGELVRINHGILS